ncbi:MAG: response regulator, partial [Deltaproteobacteria bacterium]|nr:response regulator [Deltaproteobacteria bacterium]
MDEKILFVDDDVNILEAYKRNLRKKFVIETAPGGEAGIEAIRAKGPFAVVVSDMRMPGMNGVEFLARMREKEPDTIRILLTGQADMEDTIAVVNEGNIFRFLTKPCPPDRMANALNASLEQYRLIIAERELLEKTLMGSIKVLTEILSLVNPTAFGRASRIKGYVRHMATQLKLPGVWRFEMAAMLSQIGCVTLLPDTLLKVYAGQPLSDEEEKMYSSHPSVASQILSNIPRLESIARMIKEQQLSFGEYPTTQNSSKNGKDVEIGAQMLKVALDLDQLVTRGMQLKPALAEMGKKAVYNSAALYALNSIEVGKDN